jgi:cell wall-associated NlpC family hydrolase
VATVEAQISQQQTVLDQADEQYDQATVNLGATRSALQSTSASIQVATSKLAAERSQLRQDAIEDYVSNSSAEAVSEIFAAPTGASQIRALYEGLGIGNVTADVAKVQAGQHQLSATQSKLLAEQQAQTTQFAQENQARQSAAAANSLAEATLAQVKGALAQQIAQQAAAQAAAAAQTAAAATDPAAKQAAASQASKAAQVATTLSGGSAAAASATTAANQAAGAAAGAASGAGSTGGGAPTGVATVSSGDSPQAAGLAAVHGAMQYLGVPYVWGGASYAGVDCSGLVMLAWAHAGVSLPHSAADQYNVSQHVSLSSLEPGDLLFYDLDGAGIDHVVMYVGPILDGQPTTYGSNTIIQAAQTGTVVTFDPFWSFGLVGAGRP